MKEVIMTSEGFKKLQEELEYLKTTGRDEAAEKIRVARGFGDLSENSEYDEAKNDQAALEARIAELEAQLKHVRILDESEMSSEHVHVGSKVVIKDKKGKKFTYTISGATEADPFNGKISDESPVGKAVMGLKVGEKGEAILPNGTTVVYTVVEISK
ncbi:MAG: transcription elongation factor GreA [Clostridia bacterium]|nr:transcription elongation factor GreA [Clostridia bacterium]